MIFCQFFFNLTKRALNLSIFEPQMNEYGLEREISSSTRLYLNETSSHFAKKIENFSSRIKLFSPRTNEIMHKRTNGALTREENEK